MYTYNVDMYICIYIYIHIYMSGPTLKCQILSCAGGAPSWQMQRLGCPAICEHICPAPGLKLLRASHQRAAVKTTHIHPGPPKVRQRMAQKLEKEAKWAIMLHVFGFQCLLEEKAYPIREIPVCSAYTPRIVGTPLTN